MQRTLAESGSDRYATSIGAWHTCFGRRIGTYRRPAPPHAPRQTHPRRQLTTQSEPRPDFGPIAPRDRGKDNDTQRRRHQEAPHPGREPEAPGPAPEHPQEELRATARRGEREPELTLFDDFDGIESEDLIDFYQHDQNWSNRMIGRAHERAAGQSRGRLRPVRAHGHRQPAQSRRAEHG